MHVMVIHHGISPCVFHLQIAEQEKELAAKDVDIAAKDATINNMSDVIEVSKKEVDTKTNTIVTLKDAVRMPRKKKDREVFVLFVLAREHVVVPVRRNGASMPPRIKELTNAGLTMAEIGVANVPNVRYLWKDTLRVLRKKNAVTRWPIKNPATRGFINGYKLDENISAEALASELKCTAPQLDWLKEMTMWAGCNQSGQTRIEKYLTPPRSGASENEEEHAMER